MSMSKHNTITFVLTDNYRYSVNHNNEPCCVLMCHKHDSAAVMYNVQSEK